MGWISKTLISTLQGAVCEKAVLCCVLGLASHSTDCLDSLDPDLAELVTTFAFLDFDVGA